jgi:hypothetical protein
VAFYLEYSRDFCLPQTRHFSLPVTIEDEITMVGVSPTNDDHLVRVIKNSVEHITFYYYPGKDCKNEMKQVKRTFNKIPITFLDVKTDLWNLLR